MSQKRLQLPLALHHSSAQSIATWIPEFKDPVGYHAVNTGDVSEPVLCIATDSPLRILLVPRASRRDKDSVQSCCDKGCKDCSIPLRSSFTIGHFIHRRIRKQMRKKNWPGKFLSPYPESALDKLAILTYSHPIASSQRKLEPRN